MLSWLASSLIAGGVGRFFLVCHERFLSEAKHCFPDGCELSCAKLEETADQLAAVIYNALEAIRIIALYLAPFMPNTSAEVFRRLSLGDVTAVTDIEAATAWGQLPAGNAVETGDPLFPRLDADAIDLDME